MARSHAACHDDDDDDDDEEDEDEDDDDDDDDDDERAYAHDGGKVRGAPPPSPLGRGRRCKTAILARAGIHRLHRYLQEALDP